MNSKDNNLGRPSKYKKRYCDDIIEWAYEGTLPRQWSLKLGVARSTLNKWVEQYEDFSEAWELSKDIAEGVWLGKMVDALNAVELTKTSKILNLAFQMTEVQKIEAKQEIDSHNETKVSVSFGERPE